MVKKVFLIAMLMCYALITRAQINCFAQVQMDRTSVYVQQPFKVTITVLTATWYTAPLDFDNLQIPNAFILPFDRTMPIIVTIKGKQYAGIQFYFIVFPYKDGHYTLPAINIVATTPPVGEAISKKIRIKTPSRSYIVKPIPKNITADNWLVAKDVVISQSWNKSLRKLKVGDVIKGTLTINAKGTLPQFIPELHPDSVDWAGVYPGESSLADTRDDYDANGRRTQTVTYLLEKEGDFTLPVNTIEWFNPNDSRFYKRHTPAIKIHVAANPNLGILKTMKDSLKAKQPVQATISVKHGPYLILGIPWYYFTLYSLAALCVLYFMVRLFIRLYKWLHNRYKSYLNSEQHWFNKFNRSSAEYSTLLRNLYAWWDHFSLKHSASIQKDARDKDAGNVDEELTQYYKQQYAGEFANNENIDLKKNIREYRARLMHTAQSKTNEHISPNQTEWDKN